MITAYTVFIMNLHVHVYFFFFWKGLDEHTCFCFEFRFFKQFDMLLELLISNLMSLTPTGIRHHARFYIK